jgi:hypothetical protein
VRSELGRRSDRHVELEASGKQEDAVDRRAPAQVPVMKHPKLALESFRPIGEHGLRLDPVGDAEREVDVRPAVLAAPLAHASR